MKKILIMMFLLLALFNFAHPVTPTMLESKNSPDYLYGLLFMMMSVGTLVASPFWGDKVDKYGTKKYFIISPIGYLVGQIILLLATGTLVMLFARLISGFFASCGIIAANSNINLITSPKHKARNFGYLLVAFNLGGIVGQLISGFVGHNNYYYSFYVQFIGLIIIAFLMYIFMDNSYPSKISTEKLKISKIFMIINKQKVLYIFISMTILATINVAFSRYIIYFFANELGAGSLEIGFINAYYSSIALIANLFLVKYLDKKFDFFKVYKLKYIVLIISFILIINFIFLDVNHLIILLLITILFIVLAVSIYRPFIQKFILNNTSENQGQMMGIINSFNSLGMILGSLTLSVGYELSKYAPLLLIFTYTIIGLLFTILAKKQFNNK